MGQSGAVTKAEPQIFLQVSFRGSIALTGTSLLPPILMFVHPCRRCHLGLLVRYLAVQKGVKLLELTFVRHP